MNGRELLEGIKGLAKSQGSYGRLIVSWYSKYNEVEIIELLDILIKANNITDVVDFIMLVES